MIKVIINADDLGKDAIVNAAIADALEKRCITSSTIMANTTTWEQVHKIVNVNPQASFGVHLNLTEGKALTDSPVLRKCGIVDNENCFTKQIQKQNSFPKELKNAVLQEWCAQVEKVKVIENIPVSHVDGHHHVHTIPGLEEPLVCLISKYNIRSVRRNYKLPTSFFRNIRSVYGLIIHKQYKYNRWYRYVSHYAIMSNYFSSYQSACEYVRNGFRFPDNCCIELMCHPGHPGFLEEGELVSSSAFRLLLPEAEIINYGLL